MRYYFVYHNQNTQKYEIESSYQMLLNTYGMNRRDYYFAAFTRMIDAVRYCDRENSEKA